MRFVPVKTADQQAAVLLHQPTYGRKSRTFRLLANERLTAGDGAKPTAIWVRPAAVQRTGGPSAWRWDAFQAQSRIAQDASGPGASGAPAEIAMHPKSTLSPETAGWYALERQPGKV
jgi:hypothetical protein